MIDPGNKHGVRTPTSHTRTRVPSKGLNCHLVKVPIHTASHHKTHSFRVYAILWILKKTGVDMYSTWSASNLKIEFDVRIVHTLKSSDCVAVEACGGTKTKAYFNISSLAQIQLRTHSGSGSKIVFSLRLVCSANQEGDSLRGWPITAELGTRLL